MEFDILLRLLNEKIVSLKSEAERTEKSKSEIAHLQDIIRKVKDDPYSLYTSEGSNVIKLLGYNEEQLEEIEKWKKIYSLYVQFGMDEEIIPQISIVDEGTKKIEEDLERKVMLLSDVVSRYQAIILGCQRYETLLDEVKDNGAYITEVKTLLDLLNGSNLEVSERNKIKRAVITRNNFIYQQARDAALEEKRLAELARKDAQEVLVASESTDENKDNLRETENDSLNDTKIEVSGGVVDETFETEEEREIAQLSRNLEKTFGKCTVERMQELVRTILSCESEEQVNDFLDGLKYTDSDKYLEMVDGIISLMKIDILTAKYLSDDATVEKYNKILSSLVEYKDCFSDEQKAESEAIGVDIDGLKDFERALQEYNSDPLSTPNQVIFLNNAVGRDIASIKDKETLQDIFLLIEKFRKGEIQSVGMNEFEEARELKPNNSKKRRARVMVRHISDNVYGVLSVIEKKSMRTKSDMVTLRGRERNSGTIVKKYQSNPDYASELVANTCEQMDKLVARISIKAVNTKGGLA